MLFCLGSRKRGSVAPRFLVRSFYYGAERALRNPKKEDDCFKGLLGESTQSPKRCEWYLVSSGASLRSAIPQQGPQFLLSPGY